MRELDQLPPPDFLIDGYVTRGGLNILAGAPGAGKTFLALDMALACAYELGHWHGVEAKPARVIYVAAEGHRSLVKRTRAWRALHDQPLLTDNMIVMAESIDLLNPPKLDDLVFGLMEKLPMVDQFDRFGNELDYKAPSDLLIIFDTLARCMYGGDENSASDMGIAVDTLDFFRAVKREDMLALGATVLVLHHTTKAGNQERGSSALRGAADTLSILTQDKEGILTLKVEKQKDDSAGDPKHFKFTQVAGEDNGVAVVPLSAPAPADIMRGDEDAMPELSGTRLGILQAMAQFPHGASLSDIQSRMEAQVTIGRISQLRSKLESQGYCVIEGQSKLRKSRITKEGWLLLHPDEEVAD
jgi:hypothetical protein